MKMTTLFTMTVMTTALLAGGALAQTNGTFLLTSSNTVSPNSPTTRIGIWAAWDDPAKHYMFNEGNYDLTAGDGEFLNPIDIMLGPNSSTGVINGNIITGGVNGHLWVIPGCGIIACPTNSPDLIAEYDWTTTDFTPRTVDLFTSNTTRFIMVHVGTGQRIELFPDEFTPGSGVIIVEGNCYADCDGSGMLDLFDFLCFQDSFVNGEPYACDCDTSTGTNPPVCDIFDFLCFQNAFVMGCP